MNREPTTPPLRKDHVVVCIDDEPEILSSLARLLRNEPYQFLGTQKSDEAMNWILGRKASVIIADQRMPGLSGLDFLELVKVCSPSTLRVMLSGHSELSEIMKFKKIDAIERFFRKPWDTDELKRNLLGILVEVEHRAGKSEPAVSGGS